jgi:alcohol dehydrogenase class IV
MSVVVTAPAAFDYTYAGAPARHDRAVELITQGAGVDCAPAEALGVWLRELLAATGGPMGLGEFGFTEADIPRLAAGTLSQHRLLAGAPCPVDVESMSGILQRSFLR